MQRWLLPGLSPSVHFKGWLDTRSIPFPGEPERTCDTVAHLVDTAVNQHWALPIEFQRKPDPAMFGRLLEYLARLWWELQVSDAPGERFNTGAVVVNLTGHGMASFRMELPGTDVWTGLGVAERNLADEGAAAILQQIADGSVDRCLLPWIPLMHGGNTPGIITQWTALATSEPDTRRRADWGSLVLVFADAVDTWPTWKQALEGWNVETSQQVLEWQAEARIKGKIEGKVEGKVEGKAEYIVQSLRLRFGKKLPKKLEQAILRTTDLDRLNQWHEAAITAESLEAFRGEAQL